MEVIQASCGCKCKKERSNSSASTSTASMPVEIKFDCAACTIPPTKAVKDCSVAVNKCANIAVVVVLPWVPATAKVGTSRVISPKKAARFCRLFPWASKKHFWAWEAGIAGVKITLVVSASKPAGMCSTSSL